MQKVATLIKDIPLGCKLLYVLSFVVYVVGLFSYNFSILMANLTYLTYANKQYWRLFSSVLSPGISLFSILSLIVDFCLIQFFFAKIQKKYSTIFFLTEVILQNLVIQIIFTIISVILIKIGIISTFTLLGYGWAPIIIVFSFKLVHQTEDQTVKVLCFELPKKRLPVIVVLISFVLGYSQFLCLLISVGMGYLQFVVLKRHLIKLPIGYYKFWDKLVLKLLKNRQDYIQVQFVQEQLKDECLNIKKLKAFFKKNRKKQKKEDNTQERSKHNSLNEQILDDNGKSIYSSGQTPDQNEKKSSLDYTDDRSTVDSKNVQNINLNVDQIYL